MENVVDQSRAVADGDLVGRDKITHVHNGSRRTQIEGWLDRLAEERRDDVEVRYFVDSLQFYLQPVPDDDVVGLEAKLDVAGRAAQKTSALRKKEAFSKLLENWSSYPAAQEIIAYFLAKIDTAFETYVRPHLGCSEPHVIDEVIASRLVAPVLEEMGCGPFMLNHTNVAGMVYWLAEQCYVRWHP